MVELPYREHGLIASSIGYGSVRGLPTQIERFEWKILKETPNIDANLIKLWQEKYMRHNILIKLKF